MPKKLDRRVRLLRKRASLKKQNRKMNPPVRGQEKSLVEDNRPVLERLAKQVAGSN